MERIKGGDDMRKIYKDLSKEDKEKGIIFKSTLSEHTTEAYNDTTHTVYDTDKDKLETIKRLKDDNFFNNSFFKYNIIRT